MKKLDIRILQIDLARQKETVEFVKKYADFAKECGYNYFLMYLENVIRTPDTEFFNKDNTYSMEEMKEMVDYIESIGLSVIPNFENFSHIEKFMEYPELYDLSEIYEKDTPSRGFFIGEANKYGTCGCPSNPKLHEFFDKYLTDCMECFEKSKYVLFGFDEIWDLGHCSKCKQRLANGETKKDIFYKEVMHTYDLVKSWGKTLIIADDFFEYVDISEQLPKDIIIDTWNYAPFTSEPGGHWTSRRKRDWFRWYDKIGLKYLFSVKAHKGSYVENTDSFNRYAEKYSPLGGFCTSWCRSDCFYQGSYLFKYYTAKSWLGEINSEEDRINAYAELLDGNKELAKLILSHTPRDMGGGLNITERIENENSSLRNHLKSSEYFIEQLRKYMPLMKGRAKEIIVDLFNNHYEDYLNTRLHCLGFDIFDSYETDGRTDKYIPIIEEIEKGVEEIKKNAEWLWSLDRGDKIKSEKNAFYKKYAKYPKAFKEIKEKLASNQKHATLTGEYMLHDVYGTPRAEIVVNYVGGTSQVIYNAQLKPAFGSALFSVRYKIESKPIDSLTFTASGEGACYPSYFYYVLDGKKYVVASVEKTMGRVEREQKLLENDTGFAIMGYEDGLKCFNDIEATKEKHQIKIKFKEM